MNKEQLYLKSPNHSVITVYIAKESPIQKTLNLLKREEPIVSNIKSRVTRQAIETAFQKIKSFLVNPPPSENGYIIVASENDFAWTGDYLVERDFYRCGNEFYAAPLEEGELKKLEPVGVIIVETAEATVGYIGSSLNVLKHLTSGIGGKHNKGGQSQRRFEREREMEIIAFFARIAEAANGFFLTSYPITGLLIAGPGMTKKKFLESKYLDYRLKEKILDVFDIQYQEESGLKEVLHLALPLLEKNAYAKEVKIVEDLFEILGKSFESIVYGSDEIKKQIHLIKKIIMIEEKEGEYEETLRNFSGEISILHAKGTEPYLKISSLGGVLGIKKTL